MVLVSRDNERAPFSPFYPVSSCLFVSPLPRRIHWERTVLLRVCRIDGTCSFLRRDLPENGIFHSIFSFSFFLRSFFKNFPFRSQTCIRRLTSRIKRLWRFFFYFSVDFACEKSRRKKVKNEKREITILSPLTRITCNSKLKFTRLLNDYIHIYHRYLVVISKNFLVRDFLFRNNDIRVEVGSKVEEDGRIVGRVGDREEEYCEWRARFPKLRPFAYVSVVNLGGKV